VVEALVSAVGSDDYATKNAVQQALPHLASKGDRRVLAALSEDIRSVRCFRALGAQGRGRDSEEEACVCVAAGVDGGSADVTM
jgi:hypothetical protein